MNHIEIRRAVESDCHQIAALVQSLARERGSATHSPEPLRAAIEGCLSNPAHEIWVATREAEILGYAAVHWIPFPMLHGQEGYLSDLLISQAARGQGLGRRLLAQVEERAREMGCVRLMLNVARCAESFTRQFYPTHGYRERTEFANFVKRLDY